MLLKPVKFSKKDIDQIIAKGLTVEKVVSQIETFKKSIPFENLNRPATQGDGILRIDPKEQKRLAHRYSCAATDLQLVQFIPASGAATRMFKDLFLFLNTYDYTKESLNSYTNLKEAHGIRLFLIGLDKFPFYKELMQLAKSSYANFDQLPEGQQLYLFVSLLLQHKGLNYSRFPKGLLPFHKYTNRVATPFEEHLYEASLYNTNKKKISQLHFTVSKEHLEGFNDEFDRIKKKVEAITNISFHINFSFQKPETDTIAVTNTNEPFRTAQGDLLFRPGGHGALIENLNEIDTDFIFIKNIDNVVVQKYQAEVSFFKQVLGGKLFEVQEQVFGRLHQLDEQSLSDLEFEKMKVFLNQQLCIDLPIDFDKFSDRYKIRFLRDTLNRPIRVCGMVINEGEPGGGPFWVKQESGRSVLQIVEAAQINSNNPRQQEILKSATHFNPVDLVCGVKDYKGKKFDLTEFVDPNTGIITSKTRNGKRLKALELPGLWNGGMANWTSIFIEVPLTTFNPVKTVNDLLKSAHQARIFS